MKSAGQSSIRGKANNQSLKGGHYRPEMIQMEIEKIAERIQTPEVESTREKISVLVTCKI